MSMRAGMGSVEAPKEEKKDDQDHPPMQAPGLKTVETPPEEARPRGQPPGCCSILLGQYGQIRGLLNEIGRRRDHLDLKFVCDNGRMSAHQFMLGAQSAFLRQLMLDTPARWPHSEVTLILPGVQLHTMKVVLKFLYTGRLYLTQRDVPAVKELLENVLKIDAQITLPEDHEATSPWAGQSDTMSFDDDQPGSGGGSRGPSTSHASCPSSGWVNDRKRTSPGHESRGSSAPKDGVAQQGCEQRAGSLIEGYSAPLSPPDSRTTSPAPLVDWVDLADRPPSPKIKKVATAKKSSSRQPMSVKIASPAIRIPQAPVIVAKSTGRQTLGRSTGSVRPVIPTAPQVVAKKSSPSVHHPRAQSSLPSTLDRLPVEVEIIDVDDDDEREEELVPVPGPSNCLEPTWSGQVHVNRDELPDIPLGPPSDPHWLPPSHLNPPEDSPRGLTLNLNCLPPPIPVPPANGLVIHRGKWVHQSHVERLAQRKKASSTVRKYAYKPFVTISGQSKATTVTANASDEVGTFPCPHGCGAIFERERSLDSHIRRNHHPNLKASCPECGKGLSTSSALKKHLLSHRPESDWPYFCPLCFKKFQAKGDLPKHFLTQRHRDEVPPVGSPEWIALINQGVCVPQMSDLRARSARQRRPKPGFLSHPDQGVEIVEEKLPP
ncbi:hypothetical protein TCAL_10782 [Tigriopus californicus]|uniref:BTB domain-containing protein n=1 Tax=Tigriopus californicus TaxID=6832 RepID=A0A553NBC8_TIGCA|nr:zinc finger and BTB domain-containing protein 49-like [Tigriopus californicus]TRY62752.1 hypothetical protein TCAL_10782 [Tigriopus californicus]|eukprot:TCALIF_10782-PA protein Name:"Similar to ZNF500 Zinc finger protein 500 (Homo sapiens)" AED:0.30 eAED:0.34 QI:0/-1/0/1/-1/1/1/0/658